MDEFYALEATAGYATDVFWACCFQHWRFGSLTVNPATVIPGASKVNLRRSLMVGIGRHWPVDLLRRDLRRTCMRRAAVDGRLVAQWTPAGVPGGTQGIPWLVSFAAHYYLVIRHARANTFLVDYWSSGLPPKDAGLGAIMWLAQQAEPLAAHPGGTTAWLVFWGLVGYGIFISLRDQPTFGIVWLLVILSAGLFAVLRIVRDDG